MTHVNRCIKLAQRSHERTSSASSLGKPIWMRLVRSALPCPLLKSKGGGAEAPAPAARSSRLEA